MRTADVLRLAQPSRRAFAPGLIFGLLSAACAVALLATSAYLITRAADQPPILYLSMAIVGVRAFALGRAAFRYVDRLASHDAAFRGLARLRTAIYERLIPLAPDGLRGTRRGDLLARLVDDVDELQNLPLRVIQPLLTSLVVTAAAVTVVWVLLPAAGVTLAVTLIIAFALATTANTVLAARAERDLAPARADFADQTLDLVTNLDVLTAFDAMDARLSRLEQAEARLTRTALSRAAGAGAIGSSISLLSGVATVLALVVGIPTLGFGSAAGVGAGAGTGGADAASISGAVLAVVVLVPLSAFELFQAVPAAVGAWRTVRVSAGRVADAVPGVLPEEIPREGTESADRLVPETPPAVGHVPTITLRDVSARWPGSTRDREALRGASLVLSPGDRLLVAGPSGAGKTTLAHVLVRFLDHRGSYEIDGVDARTLDPRDVRQVVGLCEQNPYLFDANLRQNLLFARETATDDELLAVLDRVGLRSWALERGGLSARLGERGALVSGGQAQRIALARLLLADFPVVLFDEPTANVDGDRADALLRDLLGAAGPLRSVIVISHTPVPPGLVTGRLLLS